MSNAARQEPVTKKHVVIVGGGFAGLNCARKCDLWEFDPGQVVQPRLHGEFVSRRRY